MNERSTPSARADAFEHAASVSSWSYGEAKGGLSSEQAARLLDEFGANDPAPQRRQSVIAQLFALFLNPLVVILLIAAAASGFLGEYTEAVLIAAIVAVGILINFIQTYRSHQAVERLREQVAPTATAMRDGAWREIRRREVVPGDLIRLSAGDLVPADAVLLQAKDLYVQQSALIGESIAAEKSPASNGAPEAGGPDSPHLVFLGTSIVSGAAEARVLATGARTAFGDIARRLATRPEETEFDRGIRQFGFLIMRAVLFLVLLIVIVRIALHRQPLESLIFAVALAVGLTPEFLPMITSVTLARGAVAMARRKVIVKQLAAIQNLGSIDVLCSDKTGTITAGRMAVERAVDWYGANSKEALRLAWLNSRFETGLRSPMDAAILQQASFDVEAFEKLDEIPFDFERRRSSVVVRTKNDAAGNSAECLLIVKGAPESIFAAIKSCGIEAEARPLDDDSLTAARDTYDRLSRMGLRVLAVAFRRLAGHEGFSRSDERDLTLAGFVSFLDPPVDDAPEILKRLKQDGIQIRIITGDSALVTRHICDNVGLDGGRVVTGDEVAQMSDTALQHVVETAKIFARISPSQKTRILLALRARGHVVGFIGDGINDAPSLHAADVGISVSNAVDVARDAAQIILVEPGLRILHDGILEGRRAFGNVTKYLLMGTSSNFGNMLSMAAASLFLPFLPMLPAQVLLNNFMYDLAQITIPSDAVDPEYLRRPHRWNVGFIRDFMILIGPISSLFDFLTFYVLLRFFHASEILFHTGWFVESLATQTLVLFVIRTFRPPWRSRPSAPLAATTVAIVVCGVLLPYTRFAPFMGFTALPASYLGFLVVATLAYLSLVEIAKQSLRKHGSGLPAFLAARPSPR